MIIVIGHPPCPGKSLAHRHVYAVYIRPLFAVNLYRDKIPVEYLCDFLVLEAFTLHDMTPVAGGIADGKEDGLVLRFGFFKGFVTPGIPVDRIICVLQ
jgi:hypothetical protein